MKEDFAITPELLAQLKAKAKKATPGPWKAERSIDKKSGNVYYSVLPCEENEFLHDKAIMPIDTIAITGGMQFLIEGYGGPEVSMRVANTNYIAAVNPQVVLAMIEKLEKIIKND